MFFVLVGVVGGLGASWSPKLNFSMFNKCSSKMDVGVETGYETMIKLNYLIWWKLRKFNWFKLFNAKLLRKAVI